MENEENCFINAQTVEDHISISAREGPVYEYVYPANDKEGDKQEEVNVEIQPDVVENDVNKQDRFNFITFPGINVEGEDVSVTSSRKGKLRLVLEMNIGTKSTGTLAEGLVTPEPDTPNNAITEQKEPVNVIVDYPDDMTITLNATVQKLDDPETKSRSQSVDVLDESIERGWADHGKKTKVDVPTPKGRKILNSTFVKPPLSSTLLYPVLEVTEIELAENDKKTLDTSFTGDTSVKSTWGSASANSSIYKTVLTDNEFGNISSITKTDTVTHEKASASDAEIPLDFRKQPFLIINSKSKIAKAKADSLTPADNLLQALRILARYRGVWGVYEDEEKIVNHLIKLNDLLSITDSDVVCGTCEDEDYREVKNLISYFTLERRFIIRSQLLHTFSLLSQKSKDIGNFIFASDIPVVLANEIATGEFSSKETFDFVYCLLQLISSQQLSRHQCLCIKGKFYCRLMEMINCAQQHYYGRMAEMLFDMLLYYHQQLGEEEDIKLESLRYAVLENRPTMQKIKQKFINYILRNVTAEDADGSGASKKKVKKILAILHDWILFHETRELFNDAELDILLVTLTHSLENKQLVNAQFEVVKTMHRILRSIRSEPSGMDRMLELVERLIKSSKITGDSPEQWYRAILKKIYRMLS